MTEMCLGIEPGLTARQMKMSVKIVHHQGSCQRFELKILSILYAHEKVI